VIERSRGFSAALASLLMFAAATAAVAAADDPWLLTKSALAAVNAGDYKTAKMKAEKALHLAPSHRKSWYYGEVIHHGHLVLGEVARRAGDVAEARAQLLEAGATPGSPALKSFGPNMLLAFRLLAAGQRDAVLIYLRRCASFWTSPHSAGRLDEWAREIGAGRRPDFTPHLGMGGWEHGEEGSAEAAAAGAKRLGTPSR
jgi:hypothetical protein